MVEVKPNKQKKFDHCLFWWSIPLPSQSQFILHGKLIICFLVEKLSTEHPFSKTQILTHHPSSGNYFHTIIIKVLKSCYLSRGIQPRLEAISLTTPQSTGPLPLVTHANYLQDTPSDCFKHSEDKHWVMGQVVLITQMTPDK